MIGKAERHDAELLGPCLAIAYKENPLVRWMFADDLSDARLEGIFTALVEVGLEKGLVYQCDGSDGAAIWFPPINTPTDGIDVTTTTAAWSSDRRRAALGVLAQNRLSQPHFYLDAGGLSRRRDAREAHRTYWLPCWRDATRNTLAPTLRTPMPPTDAFYARQGFEEIGPLPLPSGAPTVVGMWRNPS